VKKQSGFSLIELLIVVAIILIIAAIAIPNLLQARRAANETSAVGSLRTINTGEASMQIARTVFSCNLLDLGPTGAGGMGFIDGALAAASGPAPCASPKSGYCFTPKVFAGTCTPAAFPVVAPPAVPTTDYSWGADPTVGGSVGINAWCTNTNAVIYRDATVVPGTFGSSAVCAATNPPVPIS
jgi:type IV pilus assembly protein PilA